LSIRFSGTILILKTVMSGINGKLNEYRNVLSEKMVAPFGDWGYVNRVGD